MSSGSDDTEWEITAFADLSASDLYEAMRLRQRVFIVEQNCNYLDADGIDRVCVHLLGWRTNGSGRDLVAYARLVPANVKYPEPSIGRVITSPEQRGRGAGRELMRQAIDAVERAGWGSSIKIAAQLYLERFYEGFGFSRVGEPYLEDDIWHVDMLRG